MNGTHRLAQVPPGVQCFVGEEARRRRRVEEAVVSVFEGWDYEEIIPPLFDYADVFASEALAPKTYSFVGRDGRVGCGPTSRASSPRSRPGGCGTVRRRCGSTTRARSCATSR